jgi:eukaryotic-like serine/threonine-protein kinase
VGPAPEAFHLLVSLHGIEEGEALIRLVHTRALEAIGEDSAARAALIAARDRLLARAAKIADPALREGFLRAVPDNARTLAVARARLG